MPEVNRGNRPLSPHLTVYRPQMTSVSSILTRITGSALIVGALMVVAWLLAAATSERCFEVVNWWMTSILGDVVLFLSVWALWYHALAGLRHLYWDTGRGLDVEFSEKQGWVIIALSVVLTILTALIV